ncbi:J domain-containing protein [Leptolyngbyaceae cyanobacterium CCMR0082]|uniref:J domain-containing protein n=1 Tax=Adonisia turfae CCMR0082 TaxID=2304604 RepID=A0A6M0S978_9CYAN|nr:J domain-containing protein [Adonisia turfae]MDV3352346.1 J domain-containing protein [Leptothoe sp. LEGE 181152]NEZ65034.1 J domain-containing protein [Adonisia turfae CCMR0082]
MQNFRDYYEILGIVESADSSTIKQAYRRLARQFHPDLNPGDQEAEERFKSLGEAYEILSDADRKAQYDDYRRYWLQQKSEADYRDLEDFNRFVDQLLNRQVIPKSPVQPKKKQTQAKTTGDPRRRDAEASLQVPLERAFQGGAERVRLEDGRALEVDMPPGMLTGQRIRLRGQGINGGDLYLNIVVEPHPFLRVQGRDVVCHLPITPSEAVLGGQITVPTLDGPVQMTIPAGIQSGRKLRLAGKGYGRITEERGDQIVEIEVAVPKLLSDQEAELYEKLRTIEAFNPRAHLTY